MSAQLANKRQKLNVGLLIDIDSILIIERNIFNRAEGLPRGTVSGAISDALILHFTDQINAFLNDYLHHQLGNYPASRTAGNFKQRKVQA